MEVLQSLIDIVFHIDQYLHGMIISYGNWMYVILFLVVFVETGLVVMPFLPGDSLLFVTGTFCAGIIGQNGEEASLNLWLILFLLTSAAILGDTLNYYIGKNIGLKMLQKTIKGRPIVNKKHIEQTQAFYEKNGPKTIIIARFIPMIRTFAPFVAGIGSMEYKTFVKYNVIGAFVWVFGLTLLGYFFGNIPIVKDNFDKVILGIIILSSFPVVLGFLKAKFQKKNKE